MQARAPEDSDYTGLPDEEQEVIWSTLRQASKDSLYVLNKGVLGFNALTPDLHLPFCNFQQLDAPLKCAVMPRNHFKSTNASVGKPIWFIINDPQTTINLISAVEENTIGWMAAIQGVFQRNELFKWLFPEVIPSNWNDVEASKTRFTVPRDESLMPEPQPTLQATSIISGQASKHVNHAIVDDPINEQTVDKPTLVDRAVKLWKMLESTLQDWQSSTLDLTATPWGYGDVIETAIENEVADGSMLLWKIGAYGNFECSPSLKDPRYLPVGIRPEQLRLKRLFEGSEAEVLFATTGEPIFPARYPRPLLERLEKKYGPFLFSCNYRCDPFDPSQSGFAAEYVHYFRRHVNGRLECDCPAHRGHMHSIHELHLVMTVDPAFSDKDDAAESAITVGGIAPDGCRYLFKAWSDRVEPDKLWIEIAKTCFEFSPFLKDVGVESVASQRLFKFFFEYMQRIKSHLPAAEARKLPDVRIQDLRPDQDIDKKRRIKFQQTFLANGQWHFLPGMDKFMGQYNKFPRCRPIDLLDAWAYLDYMWSVPANQEQSWAAGDMNAARRDYHKQHPFYGGRS
jgi:hypothetical protein